MSGKKAKISDSNPQDNQPLAAGDKGGNEALEEVIITEDMIEPSLDQPEFDGEALKIAELEQALTVEKQRSAEAHDKMVRIAAEAENLRKRAEAEKANLQKFAVTKFAQDMVQVADNLTRALSNLPANLPSDSGLQAVLEGVGMTAKQLHEIFTKHGIRLVDGVGSKFNYDCHQAISEVPSTEVADGHILQVLQDGYWIHDRLLRPAMVIVARQAPAAN